MTSDRPTTVFFDFGGVVISSPFVDLNRYEASRGIPLDFIRRVNSFDPNGNAWARFERNETTADQFDSEFAEESERLGYRIPGADLIPLLEGEVRPAMVAAIDRIIAAGFKTACLTNSTGTDHRPEVLDVKSRFHHVVDSNMVGSRKPEPEFFEGACSVVGVDPREVVFLDDLGINLKPARAMGMTTIKVLSEEQALFDLGEILGLPLAT